MPRGKAPSPFLIATLVIGLSTPFSPCFSAPDAILRGIFTPLPEIPGQDPKSFEQLEREITRKIEEGASPLKQTTQIHSAPQKNTQIHSAPLDRYLDAANKQQADLQKRFRWCQAKMRELQSWPLSEIRLQNEGIIVNMMDELTFRAEQLTAQVERELERNTPQARIEQTIASNPNPNDCLIVATEAFARLSKSAYWARIAGFTVLQNGQTIGGHAVVFYQPTLGSNVWMYDKDGSYNLHTRSHELDEIMSALNRSLNSSYQFSNPTWENDD